ncbi:MAG: hypothetical protein Q4G02_00405 [bacterium]|nr:hypothetical protein [bacterium]
MLSLYLLNKQETQKWWLPFSQFSWTTTLNLGESGQISVPYVLLREVAKNNQQTVRQLLFDNWRKIIIYDEVKETILFKGVLTSANLNGDQNDVSLDLSFADASSLLSKRLTGVSQNYTDVNLMTVAEDLLTQAQAGADLGLTMGEVSQTAVTVTRAFKNARVLDALVGLSANKIANGFDWQFNANWQLNLAYPRLGSDQPGIIFDEQNILSFQSRLGLLGNLVNQVRIKGKGNNASYTFADQNAITAWGKQESYLSATDLTTEASLAERAATYLAENAFPLSNNQITLSVLGNAPDWQSYEVGDRVRLRLRELDLDQMLRLSKRTLTYKDGTCLLDLTLNPQQASEDFLQDYREILRRLERLENN